MGTRKEVFISSTSVDLRSYRQVAKEAVLTLGAHPIEEKNFPTDYRELQALLARRLDPIIHLVGFYYGGEPNPSSDTPRRSWTQWEYYRATQGGRQKPVYRFLARETVNSMRNQPKMRKSNVCSVSMALAVALGWRLFEARQFDFSMRQHPKLSTRSCPFARQNALDLPAQTAKEQETRSADVMRYLSTSKTAD